MKILVLSFYYPPDIGPGSLRAKTLVDALIDVAGDDLRIDVLTTMPNRYHSFATEAPVLEQEGAVSIRRINLPVHRSGMSDQARAFASYAQTVLKITHGCHWDIVVATSSRLLTAALSSWVANRCNAHLYLDIRDLFVDTMADLLARSYLRVLLPVLRGVEYRTFRSADKMNVVSGGFLPYIKRVSPDISPSVFTNGIDDEFIETNFSSVDTGKQPLVLYAGNIGEGQGLHRIIPAVAVDLENKVRFRVLGDGGRRKVLNDFLKEQSVRNVQVLDPVPRHELFAHYLEADVLLLHLNDYIAFSKVLPSKIFEYAATGKPILAGVGGFAADFLQKEVPGVEVFEPCDVQAMKVGLQRLLDGPRVVDRNDFCVRYRRKNIMREMAKEILSLKDRPS